MNFSNIVILHSLNGDTLDFWGKDIKQKFENQCEIIMPKFPIRAESSYDKFDEILTKYFNKNKINKNSLIIAHSIANAYFIWYCVRHNIQNMTYIAVAPGAVYNYPSTRNDYIVEIKKQAYLKQEEFEKFNQLKNKVTLFYSDEDDGNLEKFERFITDVDAEPLYLKGYKHFDGYHRIYQIPELVDYIKNL